MMTNSKSAMVLLGAVLVLQGCMGVEEPESAEFALAACPPELTEGAPCDASDDLACARGDATTPSGETDPDAVVCRCSASAESEAGTGPGVVICAAEPPPGGGGGTCSEAYTGAHCDPSLVDDACVDAAGTLRCRCVPASDAADCGYFWLCEDDTPPPPSEPPCDETALDRCSATGSGDCYAEDGRHCVCEIGADGEMRLSCDPAGGTTPTPHDCTPEDEARCAAGEWVECIGAEGGRCYCGGEDSGRDPARSGLVCEPWPGPPSTVDDYCTDEHVRRCEDGAAGGADGSDLACIGADGTACFCEIDASGRGRLTCR
jgi:hypothetical protein